MGSDSRRGVRLCFVCIKTPHARKRVVDMKNTLRAFNDGRWLETEVKLADGANSISWGFALGEFKTATVLRINENGEWTEHGELVIGSRPPQKMMELKVRRSSAKR